MGPLGQMRLLLFPPIPLLLKLLILNSKLVVPPLLVVKKLVRMKSL